jgi:hypothetical protein
MSTESATVTIAREGVKIKLHIEADVEPGEPGDRECAPTGPCITDITECTDMDGNPVELTDDEVEDVEEQFFEDCSCPEDDRDYDPADYERPSRYDALPFGYPHR